MNFIAKDLPALVLFLLPGFVAAGVYYTLTAHPKSSEFERVIQALIFTTILKPLSAAIRWLCLRIGHGSSVGAWTQDSEIAASLVLAVLLGLIFAWASNSDRFHRFAQWLGLTMRTSYPSEWYGSFLRQDRWIVLHLADGRRLYGWPEEWPDQPDKGHFAIDQPEWLLENNERAPLYQVERMLIPAGDVKMVEFLRENAEVDQSEAELQRVENLLREPEEGEKDGSKSATTGTEPAA